MALTNDPRDPRDDPGPYPKKSPRQPLPKSEHPPESPGASDRTLTLSEAGRAIPIVHGTAKVMGTVLELYSGLLLAGPRNAPSWQPIQNYQVGDRVTANGNTYVCTQGGISAQSGTGPSGTGTGILDGHTPPPDTRVIWDFVKAGTDLYWKQSTSYTPNLNTTVVFANGNYYQCVIAGTSAATGTGPSGTGPTVVDNTVTWLYVPPGWRNSMAIGYCEGQIVGAGGAWSDRTANLGLRNTSFRDGAYTLIANEHVQLCLGTSTGIGTRPFWFPTPDAAQRDDYSNVAVLLVITVTGTDDKISNIALEIQSGTGVSTTVLDESPADIAIDLLTHARRGAGWSTARVDTTGTLGAGASSYRTYCTAFGLNLSWVIDTQTTAMELLASLLLATNSDVVWSGGQLKFFPRGDQALTANGVTYTPVTTPAYNLTQDHIIGVIEVERRSPQSAFNSYPVEYVDRASGYVRQVVDDKDLANIDQRGLVRASTVVIPQVLAPATAIMLSRIFTQRSLRVMNTYRFRLPYSFLLLDPCDIVTLSDSITGLSAVPVRITAIEEDQSGEGSFLFEAEDYPVAVSAAATYTPQTGDGLQPNSGTSTGDVVIIPSATADGTIVDVTTSRGAAVHNMWPNAGSEASPPDGANITSAEWAARVNAGAGAFSGNWVRELAATFGQPAAVLRGDTIIGTEVAGSNTTNLTAKARCVPGETFSLEAQVRFTTIGNGAGAHSATVSILFADANDNATGGAGFPVVGSGSMPSAYSYGSITSTAPAGASWVLFRLNANASSSISGTVTAQFDSIVALKKIETQSDAATNAPGTFTVAAGGNAFTDIPGTSQSFVPNTASRKIKVTLAFTGFATGGANGLDVRIVFGGTPTQAGVTYSLFYNTLTQHQGWPFMWVLPAATLGPVGTAVTVKAQIRSPTGSTAAFNMNNSDSASMVIEEIG